MSIKKVGGIRFIRIGRYQLSFCRVAARRAEAAQRREARPYWFTVAGVTHVVLV